MRWQGQNVYTGDPWSDKAETKLTSTKNSSYERFIDSLDTDDFTYEKHFFGYSPEMASNELLTRMGDFQSYNNPRVYDDIYGTVHRGMPRNLTSNVADTFYDASQQAAKDISARNVGQKYENIDPVMVEGLKRAYPDEDVEQDLRGMDTRGVMSILQEDYLDNKTYNKGGRVGLAEGDTPSQAWMRNNFFESGYDNKGVITLYEYMNGPIGWSDYMSYGPGAS